MKHTFRNVLTVFVVAVLALAMVSCATTVKKDMNKVEGPLSGKTVILHSNDVHGALKGYAKIAGLRTIYENQGATVITVDDGDFSQGSIYVSLSRGANAVTMMNAAGYDIVGLGNHEFDYGLTQLQQNLKSADFQLICSNIFDMKGKQIFTPDTVVTVGDSTPAFVNHAEGFKIETPNCVKIGFFALETPETLTKVNPNYINGVLDIATSYSDKPNKYDLYKVAQAEVNKLSKKADIVICLGHLGVDQEDMDAGCASSDVLAHTTGIDFMIDGHSHVVMTEGPFGEKNDQSTGTQFQTVGVIVIDNATKSIEDHYLVDCNMIADDPAVLAVANEIVSAVDAEYGAPFAVSEVNLEGNKAPGNRTMETNNGDLVADAMRWSVTSSGNIDVPADHVVAITNGGGIRAAIKAGNVSKGDINKVLPFGNTVAVDYVSGAELLEALEASTYCTPDSLGGFPQVSGIVYTIDTSKKYDAGDLYPSSTYRRPNSIQRVTINSINGQPFNADDTYAVVTNNFVAAGGDTYYVFKASYDKGNGFDTAIAQDLAVMDYVSEVLNGVISADMYGSTQGRIIIK